MRWPVPRMRLAPTIDRKALVVATVVACLQDAIYALIFLSYINHYLLDVLKTSPGMPGYTLAAYGVCKLVAHPLAGRLLDRTSPRLVFRGFIAMQIAGMLLFMISGNLGVFFAGTALLAIGSGAAWPLTYDLVARTQPLEEHSAVTGMLSIFGYIATGVGFILGALLARYTPWRVAFLAGLAMVAFQAIFQSAHALGGHSIQHPPHERLALRERLRAVAVFGAMVLSNFAAVSSIAAAYGPYTHRSLGLDLLQTMFVLAPSGVAALAGLWAASHWSKPERRMSELALMAVVATAGTLALWATHQWQVAVFLAIPPAAALGGMGPVIAAAVIEYGGVHDRGLVIGTLMSIEAIGGVVGPALTASAIDIVSPGAGFGAIGVMFAFMALFAIAARRTRTPIDTNSASEQRDAAFEGSVTKG